MLIHVRIRDETRKQNQFWGAYGTDSVFRAIRTMLHESPYLPNLFTTKVSTTYPIYIQRSSIIKLRHEVQITITFLCTPKPHCSDLPRITKVRRTQEHFSFRHSHGHRSGIHVVRTSSNVDSVETRSPAWA